METDNVIALPTERPAHTRCSCGKEHPPTWYEPVVNGRKHRGRWCAPRVNPCQFCEERPETIEENKLRARCIAAGIPKRLVGFNVERHGLVQQRGDESSEDFEARVRAERLRFDVLGVRVCQFSAYRAVVHEWKAPKWLILHGPPGTGKTSLLAALTRRLLTGRPDEWKLIEGRRTLVRTKLRTVEYHRADDLVSRERVKLRGLDDAPTKDAALVGVTEARDSEGRTYRSVDRHAVLILDELGADPQPSKAEVTLIERIVGFRADEGLCTIIATNRDISELVRIDGNGVADGIYGRRVADRLRQAMAVELTGDSWREP